MKGLDTRIFSLDFLYLAVVLFFMELVRGAFLIAFLPIFAVKELGFSLSVVGLAVTTHYIADTFVKIYIGFLIDRISAKWVVVIGLALSCLALSFLPQASHPAVLVLITVLYGIGISPVWIICYSRVDDANRATQMGMLYAFWLAGAGLGPVSMNLFIDQGFKIPYYSLITISVLVLILSFRIPGQTTAFVKQAPFREQFGQLWQGLSKIKWLLPGMIFQTMAIGMLIPILPTFITGQLGLTYREYSYVLITGGLCAVLALVPMGKWSDTKGKKLFLVTGFGLFSITLLALTKSQNLYSTMLFAGILGLSYAAILPAWNALLAQNIPTEQKGMSWGAFTSVEGIGVMIGPVLGGLIADRMNVTITVVSSAIIFIAIAIFYLSIPIAREEKSTS